VIDGRAEGWASGRAWRPKCGSTSAAWLDKPGKADQNKQHR